VTLDCSSPAERATQGERAEQKGIEEVRWRTHKKSTDVISPRSVLDYGCKRGRSRLTSHLVSLIVNFELVTNALRWHRRRRAKSRR
jgi:hypothetical protein